MLYFLHSCCLLNGTFDARELGIHIDTTLYISFAILYGLLFSLPSFCLLLLTTTFLSFRISSVFIKKLLLILFAGILTIIPFLIMFGHDFQISDSYYLTLSLSYWLTISTGIVVYKWKTTNN